MQMFILLAVLMGGLLGACDAVLRLRDRAVYRKAVESSDPLAMVRYLARSERGLFGWRHVLGSLRVRLSGVPVAAMTPENWAELLVPGLRKIFHLRMRAREELFQRTEVFPTDTSQRSFEDYQGVGELGTEAWDEFEKSGSLTYDEFEKGFKTRLEHREFAMGMTVRRKTMDDNLYPEAGIPRDVTTKVEKIADSAAVKREKSAAAVFINAFTDSGTDAEGFSVAGADGVGLCSTAHPLSPTNSSDTQSNEFTVALDASGLASVRAAMRSFTDDNGELISIHPDTLLVPPELGDTARILVESINDPSSGNAGSNAVNPHKGRYQVVEWDYLTDSNAWFMIDSMLKSQHLVWLDRIAPEYAAEGSFETLQAKFRGYMRYSRGFDDWRWIAGSNPS